MSNNQLNGTLPLEVGRLRNTPFLSVAVNRLSGGIPTSLGDCQVLESLNLSRNFFQGSIPASLSNLKGIKSLRLPPCSTQTSKKNRSLILEITLPIVVPLLLFALFMTCCYARKQKKLGLPAKVLTNAPPRLSYLELTKATDDFSDENLIGVGSHGSVYRGILGDDKTVVAIKVLNLVQRGAFKAFVAECEALRNIRHRNLVKILTTCSSVDLRGNEFRAIVLDFMPNGSLESWLHPDTDRKLYSKRLGLLQRLGIAIDVAALNYLHDDCETPIIHCDLKPSNVLLDGNMTARVGDFGIARFLSNGTNRYLSSSSVIKGSVGYMAPEYGMGGQVWTHADVYSYGVLLLELFTGRRPTDDMFKDGLTLQKHVEGAFTKGAQVTGIVDPSLFSDEEEGEDTSVIMIGRQASERITRCLESVLMVGLCCAKESPRERITIKDAVTRMEAIKTLLLAPKMSLILEITLPIVVPLLLFALFMTCCYARKQKKLGLPAKVLTNAPPRLSYLELMKATDDFSDENLIGVGSHGSVYRGVLGDDKTVVAIKVLNLVQRGAFKAFVADVDLRGNEFRAIVLDFMPNGSLESWLHPDTDRKLYSKRLGLLQRLGIAIDVAAALNYLHDDCETPIIHCDLKPSNVLLDGNMTARVGDFGIARFLSNGTNRYLSSSSVPSAIWLQNTGWAGKSHSCGCLQLRSAAAGAVHGRRPTDDMFKDGLTLQKHVEEPLRRELKSPASSIHHCSQTKKKVKTLQQASERITRCLESVLMVGLCCAKESPRERITIKDAVTRMEAIKTLLLAPK
ncbi:LRR receptor-like serine threonine-protein kinase, partial [Musa troglodytarum]